MVPSTDRRIVTTQCNLPAKTHAEHGPIAKALATDAWVIEHSSMDPCAGKARTTQQQLTAPIPRQDYVAPHQAMTYVIAFDPSGKLRWESNAIDNEHVIAVLTEALSDDYLEFLRAKHVSYVFGGKTHLNLASVLEKLYATFGIKRLLLDGSGKITGSFLEEDLIDELSILVAPLADGYVGTPPLADVSERTVLRLKLVSVEKCPADLLWLRYARESRHSQWVNFSE